MIALPVSHQHGFVLPYVLLVIAVMSLSITIAANRIQSTARLISSIEDRLKADLAFTTAEAETVYSFMTSTAVQGGIDLNPSNEVLIFQDRSKQEKREPDKWAGNAEYRVSHTDHGPVIVSYRDTGGLVQLNVPETEVIEMFLVAMGATSQDAEELTAKLLDYTDRDHSRRYRGAERADYRLRKKTLPTNSPIRRFVELDSILGWKSFLERVDRRIFMDNVTLQQNTIPLNSVFMSPELSESLGAHLAKDKEGLFALLESDQPSDIGRFKFRLQTSDGVIIERAVELHKTVSDVSRPFKRDLMYETIIRDAGAETLMAPLKESKHVIHAETYRSK